MNIKYFFIFIIFLIFIFNCNKKERKVEVEEIAPQTEIVPQEVVDESTKLNPEKFFKINIEINNITKKYDKIIQTSSTEQVKKIIKELNLKIDAIYKKYQVTEEELSKYSETHYKELEKYLKSHPEIEKKLRK